MMCARLALMFFTGGLLFVGGCLPDDMPAYINDGKTIVAKADDANRRQMLWTYDVQSGKATPHPLPEDRHLELARMIGDQIWTQSDNTCMRFDPAKNEFVAGPKILEGQPWVQRVIPASWEGEKCLFLPNDAEPNACEPMTYEVFTFPEFKKKKNLELHKVLPAGHFMWVSVREKKRDNDELASDLDQVKVFNREGKQVLSIPTEELRKMEYNGLPCRFPGYAQINEMENILFLTFGDQGVFEFGIFDMGTGKFLWGDRTTDAFVRGNPVIKRKEIWYLDRDGTELVRQKPRENAGEKARKEMILKYHVDKKYKIGKWHADQYTFSPEGSHFIIVGSGKPSLMIFIPIKEGVTEKDVRVVELTD